jgi:hypothetical protein
LPTASGAVRAIWLLIGGVCSPKVTPVIAESVSNGPTIKDGAGVLDVVGASACSSHGSSELEGATHPSRYINVYRIPSQARVTVKCK